MGGFIAHKLNLVIKRGHLGLPRLLGPEEGMIYGFSLDLKATGLREPRRAWSRARRFPGFLV